MSASSVQTLARSFPPVANEAAHTLILGSVPGQASLAAQQYYAHPRNAFWPMLAELLGFAVDLPYNAKIERLQQAGIALWDVLYSCQRPGSLDSSIRSSSVIANDLPGFLQAHPAIRRVFFNGASAENYFRRHVAPDMPVSMIVFLRLPSTSPAHASLSFSKKLAAWRCLIDR